MGDVWVKFQINDNPLLMKQIQKIGVGIFLLGFGVFVVTLSLSQYRLSDEILRQNIKKEHLPVLSKALEPMKGRLYTSNFSFISDFNRILDPINQGYRKRQEWDKVIYDQYAFALTKASSTGFFPGNTGLFCWLSIGMAVLGALIYIFSGLKKMPGIQNNYVVQHPATSRGWIGIALGTFLIGFYVLLYFYPEYLTNWVLMADPLSQFLSGNPASQWFLYGTLYTLAILVMGLRVMINYRHNKYQVVRTLSVVFFQLSFAFTIPQLLILFNQPYRDLKNMWPLDYEYFFEYRIEQHMQAGTIGVWMFVWGIVLFAVAVPVITYFYGKRWYCSWVCGCGGLAETLGDPYRHLSDKRLKAWKIERWMVHSVLVFVVVMTLAVLYSYFSGSETLLGFPTYNLRSWYGFAIGSIFAGVVGTGFYPLMGNRVWCRFGCPLAAYIGLVQRFKSRFRITTNGGQCISCGNCSTYCEMGIDVRWYAQRGQDIVRSSCVGCGICSAVCPRGVLNLENGPVNSRLTEPNPILLGNEGVRLAQTQNRAF
jgi:polyferredoxin